MDGYRYKIIVDTSNLPDFSQIQDAILEEHFVTCSIVSYDTEFGAKDVKQYKMNIDENYFIYMRIFHDHIEFYHDWYPQNMGEELFCAIAYSIHQLLLEDSE